MIASILQMMGFGLGNSSPAGASEGRDGKSGASDRGGSPKASASGKTEKTPNSPKAAKAGTTSQPQQVARPAGVSVAPERKSPAAKGAGKPVAVAAKPAAAKTLKPPVPAPAKTAAKAPPGAKPGPARQEPITAAPPKAAAKPPSKPAQATASKATKSDKTAPAVAPAKPPAKPVAAPAKPAAAPAGVAKPVPPVVPVSKSTAPPVVAPVAMPTKPEAVPRAARGSRLAQLTVPSMAQAVASTAAKASYTQIMSPPPLIAPSYAAPRKDPKLANNWKLKPLAELSDAEILAMPDDEYMNDVQMAFFRHKLVNLKKEILNSAGETTEHLREDTVVVPDPADRATIEEEHALELRTRDRERKLLKKIEQSISRIDSGDYGYCDETGEPIGVGRLLARPTASLSLEAQQRRELKQKMFGD